jgi:hypothetical protein
MSYWRNTSVSTILSLFKSSARSKHTMLPKCTVRQQPNFPSSSKLTYMQNTQMFGRPGHRSRYSYSLRAGLSGVRTSVEGTYSVPIQTGSEIHPASCTTGAGSVSWAYSNRGAGLTTQPLLCLVCLNMGTAIPIPHICVCSEQTAAWEETAFTYMFSASQI